MEITPDEVFRKLNQRAERDPLVAEIIRSAALEAAVEKLQQLATLPEETPEQPDEG